MLLSFQSNRQTHHIRSFGASWSIIYGSFKSVTMDSTIIYPKSWTNCFDRKTYDILSCIQWEHLRGMYIYVILTKYVIVLIVDWWMDWIVFGFGWVWCVHWISEIINKIQRHTHTHKIIRTIASTKCWWCDDDIVEYLHCFHFNSGGWNHSFSKLHCISKRSKSLPVICPLFHG